MSERKQRGQLDLTKGNILPLMLKFFWPIMLGSLLQQLYNTVDAIVVGRYAGAAALAAVSGSTGHITGLLVGFFMGLSSGATVIIGQRKGAGDEAGMAEALHTAIALSVVGGIVLMALGIPLAEPFLRLLDTPEDVLPEAKTYLIIYFLGVIPMLVYNMGAGILRAMGDSRNPFFVLAGSCVFNILADIFLVTRMKSAVAGVAIATAVSQVLSSIAVIIMLCRVEGPAKLHLSRIRLNLKTTGKILLIGFPTGIQSSMYSISNLVMQSKINGLGTIVLAGWSAMGKIDGLFWNISSAVGATLVTFVSQNYGAGRGKRIHKGMFIAAGMLTAMSVAFIAVAVIFRMPLLGIFTTDEAVLEAGSYSLLRYVPFLVTYIPVEIYASSLHGTGDTIIPMFITCIFICGSRLVWLAIMLPIRYDIAIVSYCYPVSWTITGILFCIYFHISRRMRDCLAFEKRELQSVDN